MKIKDAAKDPGIFWETAKKFVGTNLSDLRKASINTVLAYRQSINSYIGFLETQKGVQRQNLTFADFSRNNVSASANHGQK